MTKETLKQTDFRKHNLCADPQRTLQHAELEPNMSSASSLAQLRESVCQSVQNSEKPRPEKQLP